MSTRKTKIAVMFYKAMEIYLSLYPKEREKLKRLNAQKARGTPSLSKS